jgi:hypothetical protein
VAIRRCRQAGDGGGDDLAQVDRPGHQGVDALARCGHLGQQLGRGAGGAVVPGLGAGRVRRGVGRQVRGRAAERGPRGGGEVGPRWRGVH